MPPILKKTLLTLALLGGVALLIWAFLANRGAIEREQQNEEAVRVPSHVSKGEDGGTVVTLDAETQTRMALQIQPVETASLAPERIAYGRLEEDPSQGFVLRAPFAGTLRAAPDTWPALGASLHEGAAVGTLEPRLQAGERIDLSARLNDAKAETDAATSAVTAARAARDRLKTLNAQDKSVSDRAVQEAEARLAAEEARVRSAKATARLLDGALSGGAGAAAIPLTLEREGEVVEILARPGESVEGGQPILRLARFETLIARIALTVGESIEGPVPSARVLVLGHEETPIEAEPVARGETADSKTLGPSLLYRVRPPTGVLRPGASVTAYLSLAGEPLHGVVIPRSAIVHHLGRAWVYVQKSADGFSRRPIGLDHPLDRGWFTTAGVAAGDRVVTVGAQAILSDELESQIQGGEE